LVASEEEQVPEGTAREKPSGNGNVPADYVWLEDALKRMQRCEGSSLKSVDCQTGEKFTPIFFTIGACPNVLCGKQAIMYSASEAGRIDFWWVKPSRDSAAVLEDQTLNLHTRGKHKNSPGRSKQFYQPFADAIREGHIIRGWRFGLTRVPCEAGAASVPRAFIAREGKAGDGSVFYLHFLWMEDWTSNPLASSKYLKGKLVYQKQPRDSQLFSRQCEMRDNTLFLADFEEPAFTSALLTSRELP